VEDVAPILDRQRKGIGHAKGEEAGPQRVTRKLAFRQVKRGRQGGEQYAGRDPDRLRDKRARSVASGWGWPSSFRPRSG
jgi:hypothetical protein